MPAPTPAPEQTRRVPVSPGPDRPMSDQRKYRLRRTAAGALVLLVLGTGLTKLLGDGTPANAGATTSTSAAPDATNSPSKTAAATKARSSATTSTSPAMATSVPQSGDDKITVLAMPGSDTARSGKTKTFTIEAEGGLGLDLAQFATSVRAILSSDQGWEVQDKVHFVGLTPEQAKAGRTADVRITLASPDLTDELCAPLNTNGEVSCNRQGRAVINAKRWALGVTYCDDLALYRTYLINHEVGHGLWHQHEFCPSPGANAPILQQQTLGLQGCKAWPYPVPAS